MVPEVLVPLTDLTCASPVGPAIVIATCARDKAERSALPYVEDDYSINLTVNRVIDAPRLATAPG